MNLINPMDSIKTINTISEHVDSYNEDGFHKFTFNYNEIDYIFDDALLVQEFTDQLIEKPLYSKQLQDRLAPRREASLSSCTLEASPRRSFVKEYSTDSLDFYGNKDFILDSENGLKINHKLNGYPVVNVFTKLKGEDYYYNDDVSVKLLDYDNIVIYLSNSEEIKSIRVLIYILD